MRASKETKGLVTIEEHSILGGLGEAIAGTTAESHPCPVIRIGMPDVFGELIGDFLPENGGTFSLFLCLIKRLVLVQHEIFVKIWFWAKKRAYVIGFEPVRPVSVKAILYIFNLSD